MGKSPAHVPPSKSRENIFWKVTQNGNLSKDSGQKNKIRKYTPKKQSKKKSTTKKGTFFWNPPSYRSPKREKTLPAKQRPTPSVRCAVGCVAASRGRRPRRWAMRSPRWEIRLWQMRSQRPSAVGGIWLGIGLFVGERWILLRKERGEEQVFVDFFFGRRFGSSSWRIFSSVLGTMGTFSCGFGFAIFNKRLWAEISLLRVFVLSL